MSRKSLEDALNAPFAWDNCDLLTGQHLSGLYQQMDSWMRPKCKPSLFETMRSELNSPHWLTPIHEHIGKKYRMRIQEIQKSNWDLMTMLCWEIHPCVRLAAGGMRHYTTTFQPDYPLFYLSLLYKAQPCSSKVVWDSLRRFLHHLSKAPDSMRPMKVYLRPCPITEDKSLEHLKLLNYVPSPISKDALIKKWQQEVGAFESKLESPSTDHYYLVGEEYYPTPSRSWPKCLPDPGLFKKR